MRNDILEKIKYKSISTSVGRIYKVLKIIFELLKHSITYKYSEKVDVSMGKDWQS